jgi:hypothetical protein
MKKIIMAVALIAVVGGIGFMFMKGRFGIMNFGAKNFVAGQIMLTNDSPDKMSIEYKVDGKDVTQVLSPREEVACGAQGFVRVFTANKSGSYEVAYPADSKMRSITLSQIVKSATRDQVDQEMLLEKGMVGDIKITYEEPLDLQVTY